MKLFQIFNKTPNYKKFNYAPRFYNAEEEERRDRYERIEKEVKAQEQDVDNGGSNPDLGSYRTRMQGSFSRARKANGLPENASVSHAPSPALLRMGILLILTVGFIGYLEYGRVVLYALAFLIIPVFLYVRFQKLNKRGR